MVEEAPTSFSPFSLVDCMLLFPDLARDLYIQIQISDITSLFGRQYHFPMLLLIAWSFSTLPLIANNRYLPSSSPLLFSHLGRHLLDLYTVSSKTVTMFGTFVVYTIQYLHAQGFCLVSVGACDIQTLGYILVPESCDWTREWEDRPIVNQRYHCNSFAPFDTDGRNSVK